MSKKIIAVICVIGILIVLLVGLRIGHNIISSYDNSKKLARESKENLVTVVKMYKNQGDYDRALDKLEQLLVENPNDKNLVNLMNEILALKNNSTGSNADALAAQKALKEELALQREELAALRKQQAALEKNNSKNPPPSNSPQDSYNNGWIPPNGEEGSLGEDSQIALNSALNSAQNNASNNSSSPASQTSPIKFNTRDDDSSSLGSYGPDGNISNSRNSRGSNDFLTNGGASQENQNRVASNDNAKSKNNATSNSQNNNTANSRPGMKVAAVGNKSNNEGGNKSPKTNSTNPALSNKKISANKVPGSNNSTNINPNPNGANNSSNARSNANSNNALNKNSVNNAAGSSGGTTGLTSNTSGAKSSGSGNSSNPLTSNVNNNNNNTNGTKSESNPSGQKSAAMSSGGLNNKDSAARSSSGSSSNDKNGANNSNNARSNANSNNALNKNGAAGSSGGTTGLTSNASGAKSSGSGNSSNPLTSNVNNNNNNNTNGTKSESNPSGQKSAAMSSGGLNNKDSAARSSSGSSSNDKNSANNSNNSSNARSNANSNNALNKNSTNNAAGSNNKPSNENDSSTNKSLEDASRKNELAMLDKKQQDEAARKAAQAKEINKTPEEKAAEEKRIAEKTAEIKRDLAEAQAALASGDITKALQYFDNAKSTIDSTFPKAKGTGDGYAQMADALFNASAGAADDKKAQLKEKALQYATEGLKSDPNNEKANFIVAQNSLDKKDWSSALPALEKAIANDPNNYTYQYNAGRCQYMLGKYVEAKKSFGKCCELKSDYAAARYNLGLTNLKLKDRASALSDFQRTHSIDEKHEKSYIEEARILSSEKDYDKAIAAYNKVLSLESANASSTPNPAVLEELGSAYYKSGRLAEAEATFKKALSNLPAGQSDSVTSYNLSCTLFDLGKLSEARDWAQKAFDTKNTISDKAGQVNITYNLALLCDKTGDSDSAIKYYKDALTINPKHEKSLFNLAGVYKAKSDWDSAIEYYQKARAINDSRATEVQLAESYAGAKKNSDAKAAYLASVGKSPKDEKGDMTAYLEAARIAIMEGAGDEAKKYLTEVKNIDATFRADEVDSLLKSIK